MSSHLRTKRRICESPDVHTLARVSPSIRGPYRNIDQPHGSARFAPKIVMPRGGNYFVPPRVLTIYEQIYCFSILLGTISRFKMRTQRSVLSRSCLNRRLFSTITPFRATAPFASGPAPPRLPKEDQELYERLQQQSTGAFSTPRPDVVVNPSSTPASSSPPLTQRQRPQINQSPHSSPGEAKEGQSTANERAEQELTARVKASGRGEELHPDVRRGALPEFEGERNPKTGEVGGPKNEPLRWGGGVDWSYNGRVTDF